MTLRNQPVCTQINCHVYGEHMRCYSDRMTQAGNQCKYFTLKQQQDKQEEEHMKDLLANLRRAGL